MDRHDEPTRSRPAQTCPPSQPALLALAHAPLDPGFKTRGRGPGASLFGTYRAF
jgi:hypothetical protein